MTRLLLMLLVATPSYGPTTKNQTQISTGKAGAQWFNLPDCAPDGGVHLNYRLDGGFVCATAGGGGAVGASPGTPTYSVQFNNNGVFGGASRTFIDGGLLGQTAITAHPAAPPVESQMHYAFQPYAGVPPIPYEIGSALQLGMPIGTLSGFGLQGTGPNWRTQCCLPGPGLTSSALYCSDGNPTAVGGSAGVAWDAGTFIGLNPRMLYQTVGTVNTNAVVRSTVSFINRGNAAGRGGFVAWMRFSLGTVSATVRVFQGIQFQAAATISATVGPRNELHTVYMGREADAGNGNCNICSNDGTGTATCQELDAGFPCATTPQGWYDLWFWATPNSSTIEYFVQRLDDTSYVARGTISSDLPANYVLGNWQQVAGTGYVSGTVQFYSMGVCVAYNL